MDAGLVISVVALFLGGFLGTALATVATQAKTRAEIGSMSREMREIRTSITEFFNFRNGTNQEIVRMKTVCAQTHPKNAHLLTRELK